jgi:hypothetical protein
MGSAYRVLRMTLAAVVLTAYFVPDGMAAPAPTASIAASPRLQVASAADGASATFPIDVRNFNERDPLPVSFELADLNPQGWLIAAHTTPYSLVGLATLPESLTLAPGETKRVAVIVRSDGRTHYGSVVVAAGPPTAPFARIVLKIVLTPPGAAASPDVRLNPTPTGEIRLDLRNGGDGILAGQGVLFFLSPDGHFLGRLDIPPVAALPHGTLSITLQWPEKLPSGTIARAVLRLDGREEPFITNAAVP